MVKRTYFCDCCGKEVNDGELIVISCGDDFSHPGYVYWRFDVCKECGAKIRKIIKKGKVDQDESTR